MRKFLIGAFYVAIVGAVIFEVHEFKKLKRTQQEIDELKKINQQADDILHRIKQTGYVFTDEQ